MQTDRWLTDNRQYLWELFFTYCVKGHEVKIINTCSSLFLICLLVFSYILIVILSYDLVEDRCIANVVGILVSLICETSQFHTPMHLISNKSEIYVKMWQEHQWYTVLMTCEPCFCLTLSISVRLECYQLNVYFCV